MKIDTEFCFVLFCVVFEEILCSESVAAEKTARILLRIHIFSFVYFLCVGIPILKIVLSHTYEWVISDAILLKLSFFLS